MSSISSPNAEHRGRVGIVLCGAGVVRILWTKNESTHAISASIWCRPGRAAYPRSTTILRNISMRGRRCVTEMWQHPLYLLPQYTANGICGSPLPGDQWSTPRCLGTRSTRQQIFICLRYMQTISTLLLIFKDSRSILAPSTRHQ